VRELDLDRPRRVVGDDAADVALLRLAELVGALAPPIWLSSEKARSKRVKLANPPTSN